jgi:hypothetical protein
MNVSVYFFVTPGAVTCELDFDFFFVQEEPHKTWCRRFFSVQKEPHRIRHRWFLPAYEEDAGFLTRCFDVPRMGNARKTPDRKTPAMWNFRCNFVVERAPWMSSVNFGSPRAHKHDTKAHTFFLVLRKTTFLTWQLIWVLEKRRRRSVQKRKSRWERGGIYTFPSMRFRLTLSNSLTWVATSCLQHQVDITRTAS